MSLDLHGIIPAMVTPFNADEELNPGALRKLINRLIGDGVHGVFVVGSQGEYYALDPAEKRRVMEIAVDETAGRVAVFAGTGATTTREAVLLTKLAEDVGVDAVSVLTPSFITPNEEEMYQHYRDIAAATRLPVLLYNSPGRTGVNISVNLVSRVACIENIVGIKDSSGDLSLTTAYIAGTPPTFKVFAGRDTLVFATMLHGGAGAVAACGNVAARILVRMYDACRSGDLQTARSLQQDLVPLRQAFSLGTFPAVIKEALLMTGLDVGPCRRPVGPLSDDARGRLLNVLTALGLVTADNSD